METTAKDAAIASIIDKDTPSQRDGKKKMSAAE